jgi:hypothetical protein
MGRSSTVLKMKPEELPCSISSTAYASATAYHWVWMNICQSYRACGQALALGTVRIGAVVRVAMGKFQRRNAASSALV